MSKEKKFSIFGMIFGLLIVFYDFDFFMNPGGPETPIVDYLRSLFGLNGVGVWHVFIIPVFIFILFFGFIGFVLAKFFKKNETKRTDN